MLESALLCEHERTAWSIALSSWDVDVQVCVCLHVGHDANYLQPFKESANEKLLGKVQQKMKEKRQRDRREDGIK